LSEGGSNRVNRGGSWNNPARNCRSANGNNDFRNPELAWHAEDAAMHQGEAALPGPPQVSVASLLENLRLYGDAAL